VADVGQQAGLAETVPLPALPDAVTGAGPVAGPSG
jgi:hypothetical protein